MADATDHGQLMDQTYRYQRLIYDVTRKYYLLGRDHLIAQMNVQPGDRVLELACGTGRNLAKIGKHYPDARLYGLDISDQMLVSARAKLGPDVALVQGDACRFDPAGLFGVDAFDHIVLSYSLSMIPDWQAALAQSKQHLAAGGQLHVVDFGDSAGLPALFQRALFAWLDRFHVAPRPTLTSALGDLSGRHGQLVIKHMFRRYAVYGQLTI